MKRILALLIFLMPLAALSQPIGSFDLTVTATNTDKMLIETNSIGAVGQKFTRAITLSNLLEQLKGFPNWVAGAASQYIKTNGVAVSATATSLDIITGSNTLVKATNAAGAVTIQINASASGGGSAFSGLSNSLVITTPQGVLTNAFKEYRLETNQTDQASNVIASATAGDIVQLGAGDFNLGFNVWRPAKGITIKGRGIDVTRIVGFGSFFTNGCVVIPSDNFTIEDLSIVHSASSSINCAGIGLNYTRSDGSLVDTASTNWTVRRVRFTGWNTDAAYFTHTNYFQGVVENCELESQADNIVVSGVGLHAGATNWVEFRNNKLTTDARGNPGGNSDAVGLRVTVGNVLWQNNILVVTNGANAYGIKMSGTNFTRVFLVGGSYSVAGTNTVYQVDSTTTFDPTNAVIWVNNAAVVQSLMSPSTAARFFSGSYSNLIAYGTLNVSGQSSLAMANVAGLLDVDSGGSLRVQYLGAYPSVLIADAQGDVTNHNTVSTTELGYLDGVTSAIQTQIDNHPTHAQLVTASNTLRAAFIANDTTTSNGLVAFTMTASNIITTTFIANDTTTSNGLVSFAMTVSNAVSGVSNLFSPTLSNATIKPLVVGATAAAAGATNNTGRIRGLEAGGNVTLTENGSNIVIAASVSGSGISTNGTQFGASIEVTLKSGLMVTNVDALNITNRGVLLQTGAATFQSVTTNKEVAQFEENIFQLPAKLGAFGQLSGQTLVVSNWSRILATNLAVAGTNLVADGNLRNVFTNWIASSGVTNVVFTNLLDGQTITAFVWATNGTTVQLCTAPAVQIPDAWYFDGVAIPVNTNGWSRIDVSRNGGITNVNVFTPSYSFNPGPAITASTNFATRGIIWLLDADLSNIVGLASLTFTNVPLGGTNISVRQAGGTNFIDTTGQLNNWANFTTNVWNDRQGGNVVLSNLVGTVANNVTNESSSQLQITSGVLGLTSGSVLANLVATSIDFPAPNIVSNVGQMKWNIWTNYVQTVSNFVFSFNTNRYELKNQTNVIFTNIVEEATAVGADMAIHIHNTTGVTMGLVWPAYGAQHGYFLQTNINNPVLTSTTLTTGKHGVASFTAFGTNIFATWTEWP